MSIDSKQTKALDFVVVGLLRAGTTMLRLMLDQHSAIGCVAEFEEAVSQAGAKGWPEGKWYRDWLRQDRAAISKGYTLDETLPNYQSIVGSMWSQLSVRVQKQTVGLTIHSNFDRIPELWPQAKFVSADSRSQRHGSVLRWHGLGGGGELGGEVLAGSHRALVAAASFASSGTICRSSIRRSTGEPGDGS